MGMGERKGGLERNRGSKIWDWADYGNKWLSGKESACSEGNKGDVDSIPRSGRFPWRREWQPTPVFLPREPHGQRSLVGYSPWGCKETQLKRLSLKPLLNIKSIKLQTMKH